MGLINVAKKLYFLYRSLENPSTSLMDPAQWLIEAWGGGDAYSGVMVNVKSALQYAPVWKAVNLISSSVAKLPLLTYRRAGDGKNRDPGHPVYDLLKNSPNPWMTSYNWKQYLMHHVLLCGNFYNYIERSPNNIAGTPTAIYPLPTNDTFSVIERDRSNRARLWYITRAEGKVIRLRPQNVLHIRGLGDGIEGVSVITKAKDSIGLGFAAQKYGSLFFKNGAGYDIALEHPGRLGDDAARHLKESWNKMHKGLDSSHKVAVFEEGMKASKLSMDHDSAQFLETRQFNVKEIANWFSLPPHKLGDDAKTSYASIEQENQSMLDDCLDPWLCNIEAECRAKLLLPSERKQDTHIIEFLRQAFLRSDMKSRGEFYTKMVTTGIMTRNEVRARENLNPLDGLDEPLTPLNMQKGDEKSEAKSKLLKDTIRRMCNRLSLQAKKLKDASELWDWLSDDMRMANYETVESALKPALELASEDEPDVYIERFFNEVETRLSDDKDLSDVPEVLTNEIMGVKNGT